MKILLLIIPFFIVFITEVTNIQSLCISIFRENNTLKDTSSKINLNGYYYNAEKSPAKYYASDIVNNWKYDSADKYCNLIYFYGDKTIFFYRALAKYTSSLQYVIGQKSFESLNRNSLKKVGEWGHYYFKGDTIFATLFRHDPSRFRPWIKEEFLMKIKNPNTILLMESTCERCKDQYSDYNDQSVLSFNPPKEYSFIPASIKPDSSTIKSLKKKWH